MYTFNQWHGVCRNVSENEYISSITVSNAFSLKQPSRFILIKHDVEDRADIALEIAKIEALHGLKATYYFHGFFLDDENSVNIMKSIQRLGHEVGYHYDVLDLKNGNYEEALELFQSDLDKFSNNGIDIRTICPHGNPLKKRIGWNSNKDFFKSDEVRSSFPHLFDIVNDIQLLENAMYISDAGFKLQRIGDIRDNDKNVVKKDFEISFSDILNDKKNVVLSIHTHRMRKIEFFLFVKRNIFFTAKLVVRELLKFKIFKSILSPIFKLAKKF